MNTTTKRLKRFYMNIRNPGVLLQNLSWMMVAETFSRASRFVTLFVLAATLSTAEYGTIMLALVCHELFRVFTRLGTGAKIIQCHSHELDAFAANAQTLQWITALTVAAVQIATANIISLFYSSPDLTNLLKIMALSHIVYPVVAIKVFRLQRDNRLKYFGIASGISIAFENLSIALLVGLTGSIMAVAFCKILAAVFWSALFFQSSYIKTTPAWQPAIMRRLTSFSLKILGSELTKTLRGQADSLIAGKLLSPEVFGLYSFAKSASLGISQSFSAAYLAALYPFMAARIRKGLWHECKRYSMITFFIVSALYILQSLLAPWYIELLFGDRWTHAIPLASMLCLVAIPTLFSDQFSLTQRLLGHPGKELLYSTTCTLILLGGFQFIQPATEWETAQTLLCLSASWVALGLLIGIIKKRQIPAILHSKPAI